MIILLTSITILMFSLFAILFHLTRRYQINVSFREIFLLSAMVLSLLVVITTEGLSLFSLLIPSTLKIAWFIIIILLAGWAAYLCKQDSALKQSLREAGCIRLVKLKNQSWGFYLVIALIAIQIFAILITIYLYPVPNNGDSMRYHMTRVLRWELQGSVSHFATHNITQISFPPFAEFVILQINLILGNDHLARIVQWFAMIMCVVGVSDIAKKFGANSTQQLIAALLCITIPIATSQASTTMNDLVLSAWLVCFIAFGFRFKKEPGNLFWVGSAGMALGLAILTKSTAYVLAFPFVIWFAIVVLKTEGFRFPSLKAGLVIGLMILLINAGHFTRNTITFGNPIGENAGTINDEISLRVLVSNLIRNVQNHFPAKNKNYPKILNWTINKILKSSLKLHQTTGFDIEDPLTTFEEHYVGFKRPGGNNTDEMRAGAFLHLLLIVGSLTINLVWIRNKKISTYSLSLVVVFILFALLLKVHFSDNRLQLPIFILWAPIIGVTLFRSKKRYWVFTSILIWLLSLPWVVNIRDRPIIPQLAQEKINWNSIGSQAYFISTSTFEGYDRLTDFLIESQCTEIGIVAQDYIHVYEYPFWIMLQEKGFTGNIEHYLVLNRSNIYESPQFSPCAIFSVQEIDFLPNFSGTYFGRIAMHELWGYVLTEP